MLFELNSACQIGASIDGSRICTSLIVATTTSTSTYSPEDIHGRIPFSLQFASASRPALAPVLSPLEAFLYFELYLNSKAFLLSLLQLPSDLLFRQSRLQYIRSSNGRHLKLRHFELHFSVRYSFIRVTALQWEGRPSSRQTFKQTTITSLSYCKFIFSDMNIMVTAMVISGSSSDVSESILNACLDENIHRIQRGIKVLHTSCPTSKLSAKWIIPATAGKVLCPR